MESASRAYKVNQTLSTTHQDGCFVSYYYTKMCGIWDEIQSLSLTPRCMCGKYTCDLGKKIKRGKRKEKTMSL